MDQLKDLHRAFQQGRVAALLEALAICRERSGAVPTWVIDALLTKREAIVTALKPPAQQVHPVGLDMLSWGVLGVEEVPAGKGVKIVAGRARQAKLRATHKDALDATVRAIYFQVLAGGEPRHRAVTATYLEMRRQGISLSRSQILRILGHAHRRAR